MRSDVITINVLAGIGCLIIYLISVCIKRCGLSFYNLLYTFCCGPGIVTGILLLGNVIFVLDPKYVINERLAVAIGGITLTCFAFIGLLKAMGVKFKNNDISGNNIKA